jgi:Carbohydrate-selective porin, OprB family
MSKKLSTFKIYAALIGLAIVTMSIYPAIAETDLQPHQSPLLTAEHETTTDRVKAAASAEEIQPGDWAYQTLATLNSKYECGNLPSQNRTLSREEFAANLNSCIKSMEQLVARKPRKRPIKKPRFISPPVPTPELAPEPLPTPEVTPIAPTVEPTPPENSVSQKDLDELKQLIEAFRAELGGTDLKLDVLSSRITALKNNSFSTTTKLVGEAIFAVTGLAGGPATATRNTIFTDRVRLNFRSSFTGKDLLWARLQSINSNSFSPTFSGTNMTRLGFEGNGDNGTTLQKLQYKFPFTPQTTVFLETTGAEFNDNVYNFNPELQSAGTGSITRFGRFNPIYRLSGTGAGVTIDHKFNPNFGLVLGYAAPQDGAVAPSLIPTDAAANPAAGKGLFNGSNVLFSQLAFKPSEDVNLGLIYARSYSSAGGGVSGNNGSTIANNPFNGAPTSANHYALLTSVNLSKNLVLSGWGGLTQANREDAAGSADIWNYALTVAAKDVGAPGNTLGFVVGVPPKLTSNSGATAARVNTGTSLHLEAFYKYKLSDNLTITPGILVLTNPEHNSANPTEYLGTIRTTFSF